MTSRLSPRSQPESSPKDTAFGDPAKPRPRSLAAAGNAPERVCSSKPLQSIPETAATTNRLTTIRLLLRSRLFAVPPLAAAKYRNSNQRETLQPRHSTK
jgi:hypothetical protein